MKSGIKGYQIITSKTQKSQMTMIMLYLLLLLKPVEVVHNDWSSNLLYNESEFWVIFFKLLLLSLLLFSLLLTGHVKWIFVKVFVLWCDIFLDYYYNVIEVWDIFSRDTSIRADWMANKKTLFSRVPILADILF